MQSVIALSELLGSPVVDANGGIRGRVREVYVDRQADPKMVSGFIVKSRKGKRMLPPERVHVVPGGGVMIRNDKPLEDWADVPNGENMLYLDRDLLDQQIIDVNGRKVVRVNDVDLLLDTAGNLATLRVNEVDVGPRGALRRLLKGLVPRATIRTFVEKFAPKTIPWDFVNMIEVDPARRVRLKIQHDRLNDIHPADLADILEDLGPAQREAVFEELDEETAAETIEEIEDENMQVSLMESLEHEHAADIVEEMDPDAAADLLAGLDSDHSVHILQEMEQTEREEVQELLEFDKNTAAGHMTTDYIALSPNATCRDAIDLLQKYEGAVETVGTIYLVDKGDVLEGAVPLAKIAMSVPDEPLKPLVMDVLISCKTNTKENEFVELFDKYNLTSLPVVDDKGRLAGIITSDDVISMLRENK